MPYLLNRFSTRSRQAVSGEAGTPGGGGAACAALHVLSSSSAASPGPSRAAGRPGPCYSFSHSYMQQTKGIRHARQ